MSHASLRTTPRAKTRSERLQSWCAALVSALLHLLLLLLLLSSSVPTVSDPDGAAGGSRMKVDFVGETRAPVKPVQATPRSRPPRTSAATPVQTTLATHADNPLPPDTARKHERRPSVPQPEPPPDPDTAAQTPDQATAASPPATTQRRPETWTGRPPGMLEQDIAHENAGMANSPAISQGSGRGANASGPSLEVGGYQVYYDLRSETQLRAWKAQGMKELSILLPGTDYRMACPLEIALRRGSGKCRLLEPDSPELQSIGDAREVINMMDVYHRGERIWHGPGPYR